jgi:hypothetical protein
VFKVYTVTDFVYKGFQVAKGVLLVLANDFEVVVVEFILGRLTVDVFLDDNATLVHFHPHDPAGHLGHFGHPHPPLPHFVLFFNSAVLFGGVF